MSDVDVVGWMRGIGTNGHRVEIMWHRRETRRQTEETNLNLYIGRNRSARLKCHANYYHDFKKN